ncbi:MAG: ATP-dependent sacrificial sulfur transferase LarE [Candidatus Heimdallarchaeota archaeon]|nr:ATP-dependent sacrificial sulfur transferase LarE [Candidatus Heimdallarchaeota archaeon]
MNQKMLNAKLEVLKKILLKLKKVVISFSGGIDSTFLATVSSQILGNNVTAVTVDVPQLPRDELDDAKQITKDLGITHYIIDRSQIDIRWFEDNPKERCYICKKVNLVAIAKFCTEKGIEGALIEGTNFDDLEDHRPGYQAVQELNIHSPLVEAKITKAEIRQLSKELGINCWDKPSSPCLATRFPFGEKITLEKLNTVYKAEKILKELGLTDLRVRVHGKIARIETNKQYFNIIFKEAEKITNDLQALGFEFITLDLSGYKKGSMNREA